eukprot:gene1873-biopygen343
MLSCWWCSPWVRRSGGKPPWSTVRLPQSRVGGDTLGRQKSTAAAMYGEGTRGALLRTQVHRNPLKVWPQGPGQDGPDPHHLLTHQPGSPWIYSHLTPWILDFDGFRPEFLVIPSACPRMPPEAYSIATAKKHTRRYASLFPLSMVWPASGPRPPSSVPL